MAFKIGALEIGTVQSSLDETRLGRLDSERFASLSTEPDRSASSRFAFDKSASRGEVRTRQVGAPEISLGQLGVGQLRTIEPRFAKLGRLELCANQLGARQHRFGQGRTSSVAREVGSDSCAPPGWPSEIGLFEIGARKIRLLGTSLRLAFLSVAPFRFARLTGWRRRARCARSRVPPSSRPTIQTLRSSRASLRLSFARCST
jgi:hypothetical protein